MVSTKHQLVSLVAAPVHYYMQGPQCTSKARLEGKTVVITGANTGIGKYTALDMSRSDSRSETIGAFTGAAIKLFYQARESILQQAFPCLCIPR